ncbi:hypothetical protein [Clostridium kluyveri]|uniref:Uncharacterized protein n=1 Tax=Clostridium kluyveri TaxID=1534 RepID=A0A1L5FBG8_CLOKL|nr:hypothetical protein [Clostridium kluyveri]APM40342.1 hypothetical protein BS101_17180 [Clostridium kluyveri]
MKKKTKIIAAVVLVMIVAIGGYYCYEKYSLNKRIQTSNKIMQDKGVQQNNIDKAILDEIFKNDSDLEYAYISHNDETIMLNLKLKKGIQDKDKYSKISKYMDKLRAQYKGKNINATVIPNE